MPKKPKVTIRRGTAADLAKYGSARLIYIGDLAAGTSLTRAPDGEFYATHPDHPVKLVGYGGIRALAKDGIDG